MPPMHHPTATRGGRAIQRSVTQNHAHEKSMKEGMPRSRRQAGSVRALHAVGQRTGSTPLVSQSPQENRPSTQQPCKARIQKHVLRLYARRSCAPPWPYVQFKRRQYAAGLLPICRTLPTVSHRSDCLPRQRRARGPQIGAPLDLPHHPGELIGDAPAQQRRADERRQGRVRLDQPLPGQLGAAVRLRLDSVPAVQARRRLPCSRCTSMP